MQRRRLLRALLLAACAGAAAGVTVKPGNVGVLVNSASRPSRRPHTQPRMAHPSPAQAAPGVRFVLRARTHARAPALPRAADEPTCENGVWSEATLAELGNASKLPEARSGACPARRARAAAEPRRATRVFAPSLSQVQCWRKPPCIRWSWATLERCRACDHPPPSPPPTPRSRRRRRPQASANSTRTGPRGTHT